MIAPIPAIHDKNITIHAVKSPSVLPQNPSSVTTPRIKRKTPMISVFRSFEIFLNWRMMGLDRLRVGLRELGRFELFFVVVFLAMCLNRNIVLIIARGNYYISTNYFLFLRRKWVNKAEITARVASRISVCRYENTCASIPLTCGDSIPVCIVPCSSAGRTPNIGPFP